MSRLAFTLRERPDQRLDLSGLVPEKLVGLNRRDIEGLVISTGKTVRSVGDVFKVTGAAGETVVFNGGDELLDRIGAGMTGGVILVDGDCGAGAGMRLAGGRLEVRGSAGPMAGAAMASGVIEIIGDAGDFAGGAVAGEMHGMEGGVLMIRGRAGDRAGDGMRRGLIVVGGDAGALAGSRMIAGSLLLLGQPGARVGRLMRRGTILCGTAPREVPATFNDCGVHDLTFLSLYGPALAACGLKLPGRVPRVVRRFAGDMALLGKGELLIGQG